MVRGSDEVFRAIKDYCGIESGQTSQDMLWSCDEVECLAACANAPMIQINNEEVYEDLNYENTKKLLENLANGTAKPGPQIPRNRAEGPLGRTCLKNGIPPPSPCRDFEKLKQEMAQQQQTQQKPKT